MPLELDPEDYEALGYGDAHQEISLDEFFATRLSVSRASGRERTPPHVKRLRQYAADKAWRARNPEKAKEATKRWAEANRERRRAYRQAWYQTKKAKGRPYK